MSLFLDFPPFPDFYVSIKIIKYSCFDSTQKLSPKTVAQFLQASWPQNIPHTQIFYVSDIYCVTMFMNMILTT
jgi:hypothetical protein